jgi:hypothetical protein
MKALKKLKMVARAIWDLTRWRVLVIWDYYTNPSDDKNG